MTEKRLREERKSRRRTTVVRWSFINDFFVSFTTTLGKQNFNPLSFLSEMKRMGAWMEDELQIKAKKKLHGHTKKLTSELHNQYQQYQLHHELVHKNQTPRNHVYYRPHKAS